MQTWLNSIGLICDLLGALGIFRYGLPESLSRQGHQPLVLEQGNDAEAEKARRYDKYSRVAVLLLIVGFLLQLIANLI